MRWNRVDGVCQMKLHRQILIGILWAGICICWPQSKPADTRPAAVSKSDLPSSSAANLEPNETQKLRLENAQLRLQLAVNQLRPAQQQYQQRLLEFFEMCDQVKKENRWDKAVTCSPETLQFSPPPPPQSGGAGGAGGASPSPTSTVKPSETPRK